jgi:hypothetical protein
MVRQVQCGWPRRGLYLLAAARHAGVLDLLPLDGKTSTAGVDLDELDSAAGIHTGTGANRFLVGLGTPRSVDSEDESSRAGLGGWGPAGLHHLHCKTRGSSGVSDCEQLLEGLRICEDSRW